MSLIAFRFDADRLRQERFAQVRLQGARTKLKFPYEDGEKERDQHKSALELRLDVVKETFWRFLLEREVSQESSTSHLGDLAHCLNGV